MIWLLNFPLPPSVNEYLMPVPGAWAVNKKGKTYRKGRFVKTEIHTNYVKRCWEWRYINRAAFDNAQAELVRQFQEAKLNKQKFALRVDCYFAFEHSRIWTVNNLAEQIDSDNRLKPCRDALSKLLGIDDKYFFSGFFEKVSTNSKELECSILRISLATPRTMDDVLKQIKLEKSQGI